ncbi:hypothetical protein SAMN04487768_1143 [Burkholderia sp. b13]|nr:hypothetical protein SAMN04487768_1143 [Burkholderia sp. b13]
MNNAGMSLRLLIDKWFSPTLETSIRIARFSRMHSNQRRYVCIEALRPTGVQTVFFFRHDDGSWQVFPPAAKQPTMRVTQGGI